MDLKKFLSERKTDNRYKVPTDGGTPGELEQAFLYAGKKITIPSTDYEDCTPAQQAMIEKYYTSQGLPAEYAELGCVATVPFLPPDIKTLENLFQTDAAYLAWKENDHAASMQDYLNNAASDLAEGEVPTDE